MSTKQGPGDDCPAMTALRLSRATGIVRAHVCTPTHTKAATRWRHRGLYYLATEVETVRRFPDSNYTPVTAISNYSLVTVGTLGRGKLPFFVGARGFEPRASWSQRKFRHLFWQKKGDSETGRVHTAHIVHEGAERLTQICHTLSYRQRTVL
jgi:hypothetical protein